VPGKVLFVIPDNYQTDNHFPLGPAYLAAILREHGVDVSVYCMDIYHYSNEDLAEHLDNNDFSMIGVGFLAARYVETIRPLLRVIGDHKRGALLMVGGHGPSPIPEFMLEDNPSVDVVCIGESEETIVDLVSGRNLASIRGVAYREDGEVVVNDRRKPIRRLDDIPFPAWDLFPMDEYTTCLKLWGHNGKTLSMLTSRGCNNNCSFCYRMEKGIRFRSVGNIIEEIEILKERYDVTGYFMADELFTASKSRVSRLHDALRERDLKIKFSTNARVDNFSLKMAQTLVDMGCTFINIGFESSSQEVLNKAAKNATVEENIRAAEICREVGLGFGLNFLWNLPGDTTESLQGNVDFIKRYNSYDQLRTVRPVCPYPGSPLYYQAIDEGLLEGPGDFFENFKNSDLIAVNFMHGMNDYEVYKLLFDANSELIHDYQQHTDMSVAEAEHLIEDFRRLYFSGDVSFRGARHYEAEK